MLDNRPPADDPDGNAAADEYFSTPPETKNPSGEGQSAGVISPRKACNSNKKTIATTAPVVNKKAEKPAEVSVYDIIDRARTELAKVGL